MGSAKTLSETNSTPHAESNVGRVEETGAPHELVLVDMKRSTTIRNEDQLSKAAQTPFAGRVVQGAPVQVFLRGIEIAREGRPCAGPVGKFLRPR